MKCAILIALVTVLALGTAAAIYTARSPQPSEPPVIQWPEAELVQVEYSVYGGMVNEALTYTLNWQDNRYTPTLTVEHRQGDDTQVYTYSPAWNTMDDFERFIMRYDPAGWASLPDQEFFALDAPVRRIALTYGDGTEYAVTDSKDVPGALFWETLRFLESYTVASDVFELTFPGFDGSGLTYTPVFSAPEMIWYTSRRDYGSAYDPMADGSAYEETLTFHGRIPGELEMTVVAESPELAPEPDGQGQKYYMLHVDENYNVTCVGEFYR